MKFGFPILLSLNEGYEGMTDFSPFVWVSKRASSQSDETTFSVSYLGNQGKPIGLNECGPFGANETIQRYLAMLKGQKSHATFWLESEELYEKVVCGGNDEICPYLSIEGGSYGLLMALICQAESLPQPTSASEGLLISACASIEDWNRLAPFVENESTIKKFDFVRNYRGPRLVLAVHPDNADALLKLGREARDLDADIYENRAEHQLAKIPLTNENSLWETAERILQTFRVPVTRSGAVDFLNPKEFEEEATRLDLVLAANPSGNEHENIKNAYGNKAYDQPLLEIQKKAWLSREHIFAAANNDEGIYPRDLFISGPTGCGKTALTEALIINTIIERNRACIFMAPTRSLAYEVHRKLKKSLGFMWNNESYKIANKIIVSTGERSELDWRLVKGDYKVAILVSEKASVLIGMKDSKFLDAAGLVIIDELHMIADRSRGGVVDLLLNKIRFKRNHMNERLQIVGISTEGVSGRISRWWSTIDENMAPLELVSTTRKPGVNHSVILYNWFGNRQQERNIETKIDLLGAPFSEESQRRMIAGEAQFEEKVTDLEKKTVILKDITRTSDGCGFFSKFLNEFQGKHKTILFAYKSKSQIIKIANGIFKLRFAKEKGEDGDGIRYIPINGFVDNKSCSWWAGFIQCVEDLDETQSAKDLRTKWARAGVFVHDTDTPLPMREWIEEKFSTRETPLIAGDDLPAIILSTETLTYGVNMCVDAVVIGSLNFARTGNNGRVEEERLDANQYHNLMGRAGRLGMTELKGDLPEAVICIPYGEILNGNVNSYWRHFMKKYYCAQNEVCISGLLSSEDVTYARERRNAIGNFVRERRVPRMSLERFQSTTFRAVVDSVHFLNQQNILNQHPVQATLEQLYSFIGDTIYRGTSTDTLQDREANNLVLDQEQLVRDVLDSAVEFGRQDEGGWDEESRIRIVKIVRTQPEPSYVATAAAKALIDTGTRLSSVHPLTDWLAALRKLEKDFRMKVKPDMIVPSLILTKDYWSLAAKDQCRELSYDSKQNYSALSDLSRNVERAEALLCAEYKKLFMSDEEICPPVEDFKNAMRQHCKAHYSTAADREERISWIAFCKMTAMAWAWLRGESPTAIVEMYDDRENTPENADQARPYAFHSRYAERLSWLSVMMHRFFGETTNFIPESIEKEMPSLARRLKVGLPTKGLPFLGRRQNSGSRRSHITDALKVINPRTCLEPFDPEAPGITNRFKEAEGAFRNKIRSFYSGEVERLSASMKVASDHQEITEIVVKIADQYKDNLNCPSNYCIGEAYSNYQELIRNTKENFHSLAEIISRSIDDGDRTTITSNRDNDYINIFQINPTAPVFHGQVTSSLTLFFASSAVNAQKTHDEETIKVWLPWFTGQGAQCQGQQVAHMTGLGALVALTLWRRGLISLGDWSKVAKEHHGKPLSLRTVVANSKALDLKSMPSLLNALLEFEEPGIL